MDACLYWLALPVMAGCQGLLRCSLSPAITALLPTAVNDNSGNRPLDPAAMPPTATVKLPAMLEALSLLLQTPVMLSWPAGHGPPLPMRVVQGRAHRTPQQDEGVCEWAPGTSTHGRWLVPR